MPRTKQVDRMSGETRFTETMLQGLAKDLQSGRLPLHRAQVSDELVAGLRANVSRAGTITYHITYTVGDTRPMLRIGSGNKEMSDYISITEARHLAKTIKTLGDKGIDVQDGLYNRLIRELKEQGDAWRPHKADKGKRWSI